MVAIGRDNRLYVFLAAAASNWERQLEVLFDLPSGEGELFDVKAEAVADKLHRRYKGVFPPTVVFSEHARKTFDGPDVLDDPDAVVIGWVEWETRLFTLFEERIIIERINQGFHDASGKPDVEGFLSYARSVGNTHFSRAGRAFEHHVAPIFATQPNRGTSLIVRRPDPTANSQ